MIPELILNNGICVPSIGFGTWKLEDQEKTIEIVQQAVHAGYRHIDTAAYYGNERQVGRALAECGVPRQELFVVSKVWSTDRGYDRTVRAFQKSLADLGLTYLDLYLIHWPASPTFYPDANAINLSTWRALETLYQEGLIRAIGVSNFLPHHLEPLLDEAQILPAVNQIRMHPGVVQSEVLSYCRRNRIQVEAWRPLGAGRLLTCETVLTLAQKYQKTPAQICVRWCIQHDALPLVKSSSLARMRENMEVFDFSIAMEDMTVLDAIVTEGCSAPEPDAINYGIETP